MNLSILNKEQKEAVIAGRGPVLVIAGAGSGKTRVLTYRIAYLIEELGFEPQNILAVTFTNKAAKEMKVRVEALLGGGLRTQPTMGTFHSIGVRILRREIGILGYSNNFTIIDSDDQNKLLKEIIKAKDIDERYSIAFFKAEISRAKNLLQTPGNLNLQLQPEMEEMVREVYTAYANELHKQNLVDFDDLLVLPVKIFEHRTDVLEKYQKQFRYILVDEYQDTNHVQYLFLKYLAPNGDIFVVGDDAQSIYGFRGSNIRNILEFEKDFPNALTFVLEQNYRSTKHILAVAQEVIELNKDQKPKILWTENDTGERVRVEEVENERAEALFVVKKIVDLANEEDDRSDNVDDDEVTYEEEDTKPFSILDHFLKAQKGKGGIANTFIPRLKADHVSLNNFAVLFRTHSQSRALEEAFIHANIPYQIVGGVKFYERKEVKDVLAYLRLIMNIRETLSLKRVLNIPPRGIGEKSIAALSLLVESLGEGLGAGDIPSLLGQLHIGAKQKEQAGVFFSDLHFFASSGDEVRLSELVRLVVKRVGFEKYLRDKTQAGEDRLENVKELISVAKRWDKSSWKESLPEFLEEVALLSEVDTLESLRESVTLMTLHAAKGLEFDTVFFVGLEEGLLPHSRSLLSEKELSEEIRLAYVGLTRARQRLYLLYARTRTVFGDTRMAIPSRILKVLPDAHVSSKGSKNLHVGDNELVYETIDL